MEKIIFENDLIKLVDDSDGLSKTIKVYNNNKWICSFILNSFDNSKISSVNIFTSV
jgi:hypothetical protein